MFLYLLVLGFIEILKSINVLLFEWYNDGSKIVERINSFIIGEERCKWWEWYYIMVKVYNIVLGKENIY